MASLSLPEKPDILGYGVAKGNGVLHLQLTGAGLLAVGGSLSLRTARELARTILEVAGEEDSDAGT